MADTLKNPDAILLKTAEFFGRRKLSTDDFVKKLGDIDPVFLSDVVVAYGEGGKGAGRNYTSNSWISQQLVRLSNHGHLFKLDYEKAPKEYGSPFIRYWTTSKDSQVYPDELPPTESYYEGARQTVTVNKYERDAKARDACIAHHGSTCQVCDFDFGSVFGEMGKGFIHVHHITPLSSIGKGYVPDPINDLVPVCPNCHAMLHRTNPPLQPAELRVIISETR